MSEFSRFKAISPLDFRYWDRDASSLLSEEYFIIRKLYVEFALATVLCRRGLIDKAAFDEIAAACFGASAVTAEEVYEEERRIGHDIRALANCIQRRVSDRAKPYVHLMATSQDIIDTANASRYWQAIQNLLLPRLLELESALITIAEREAETLQIGRTHGQHAVPITFGFAMAGYVSRLGNCIEEIKALASRIRGKFSGAVGAYNALKLLFDDPEVVESEVLAELGIKPAEHSTQIVQPEALMRLLHEVVLAMGIMANLADDMRNLSRPEIAEVGEAFGPDQVGSSTMPHKRNPIHFERVKSFWKIVMPRYTTLFLDQLSEHQRDGTNLASSRTYPEALGYATFAAHEAAQAMRGLSVYREKCQKNLELSRGSIMAEPLYVSLAVHGHPDAHEKVRQLTLKAERSKNMLMEIAEADPELKPYWEKMTARQEGLLFSLPSLSPSLYTGIAAGKARKIAAEWKEKLGLK
ncbi:MAG: adenylosuccinate lyase [Candidatus Niyogibacteria bacterium]|nr:adenylosuccinate lyase [Candidatus Niyogibacteria bacterium]